MEEFHLMDHVDQLLSLFDLSDNGDTLINSYSTGQRKKVSICSALISEAPVMIFDEPFSGGLGSAALHALGQIFKQLADCDKTTVLMTVPVPELVKPLAHKVAIVADGQILAYDTVDTLRRQKNCTGSLTEVLESFTNPKVLENIKRYLERTSG